MNIPEITIYSTPTCAFCHMAKEYFKSKRVAYTDKDVTMDNDAQKWVLDHTGQLAVPVINIAGNVIIGFDRERIDLLLRDKKLV